MVCGKISKSFVILQYRYILYPINFYLFLFLAFPILRLIFQSCYVLIVQKSSANKRSGVDLFFALFGLYKC